ncbi:hypothetical protein [Insolitispirillum peregrinum]|uniref:Uncharacterized protein n=1 Tax=Insolitispirillum peregrinum TaxID=80876 RepID=A0A1N7ISA5_9PROT|nr:hypothetical protein [Insolitispirillum peregrinum]SIS39841.1 hypothetical protein SAMN05421779_101541 [Insolitispirillum peregrinum]
MTTVAAISFHDNHSISMDVEGIQEIVLGRPMQVTDDQWFCELVIHTENGKLSLQLLADDAGKFKVDSKADGEADDFASA